MIDEMILIVKAAKELVRIFGKEYIQENYKKTCFANGIIYDNTYMLFAGIKDSDELPNREATDKGWVVYAKILLNATTGEIIETEYVLE